MTPAAIETAGKPAGLPKIRNDIAFELAPGNGGGFPALIVTDPVRGSYFRLSWPDSGILLHWRDADSVEDLQSVLMRTYGLVASAQDIQAVAEFAFGNQLTIADSSGGWQRYANLRAAGQHGAFKTLIHGYLFFRIPLVHPENWLQRLLPRVAFVYSRLFWCLVALTALVGVYFATRQWTSLVAAAEDALNFEVLLLHAAAILGLKAVHELGHALTTVRYGCRVPSMGVAFMLGAPVLYTDTSDSWRLPKCADRLAIVFAGVAAELIVAAVALLLWAFLPDGTCRQICFALATASIILSLAVNLNPFMRFDGYFALSDYLEVPNLQQRAFALATWQIREALFDLGHPPPEVQPPTMHRTLVIYALITWVYRLLLYLGIAAVVYMMAGKALGIILGIFEVIVFIIRPIAGELSKWWELRAQILRPKRARWTGAAMAGCLGALFVPWMTSIEAPSVLVAAAEEAIYLPFAARLSSIEVKNGQHVEAGQILFRADSTDLDRQQARALVEQRSLQMQNNRLHANDKELEARLVLRSKLAQSRAKIESIEHQRRQLDIRAPFAGVVADLDADVSAGNWLNPKLALARVLAMGSPAVRGLVAETDVARLSPGASAVFIGDDPTLPRRELKLVSIAPASDGRLMETVLADRHGGAVASGENRGELRTRQGWFEVTFESADESRDVSTGKPPVQILRGAARVQAASASPFDMVWRQIARVLVREQGF
jgi:putative peptide zinc metalloprotease protein